MCCGAFHPLLLTQDILATPITYSEFCVDIPQGAGIGVQLDTDKVNFFRRDGGTAVQSLAGE